MRLTLVNQFYAPDISPTAQLAASLAEHRAEEGDHVTIVTGRGGYLEGVSPVGELKTGPGLRIQRVWTPDLGKSSRARRLLGYVSFSLGSALRMVTLPRQDVVVAMTPQHARLCADAGMSRGEVQQRLWELAERPQWSLKRGGNWRPERARAMGIDPDDDEQPIKAVKDPDRLHLIVAGGVGPITAVCHGWNESSRAVHGVYAT